MYVGGQVDEKLSRCRSVYVVLLIARLCNTKTAQNDADAVADLDDVDILPTFPLEKSDGDH